MSDFRCLEGPNLQPKGDLTVRVVLRNAGTTPIPRFDVYAKAYELVPGVQPGRKYPQPGDDVGFDDADGGKRVFGIPAGGIVEVEIPCMAPKKPGQYELEVFIAEDFPLIRQPGVPPMLPIMVE